MKIELTSNAKAIVAELQVFPRKMAEGVALAMDRTNADTISHVQKTKLMSSGPTTLGPVSRQLLRSVRSTKPTTSATGIDSAIGSPLVYAGVHEYGAVINAENKPYLRFNVGGRWVQKKRVTIPARRWLSTGIQERAESYTTALSKPIEEAWAA